MRKKVLTGSVLVAVCCAEISKIPGVVKADGVTGPYDVIVHVQAEDTEQLLLVTANVHSAEGVTRVSSTPIAHVPG
ncbi:Lrp/AsnC ligand binding domain-containing protein [Streptomyces violascens]|uniref:Lrp/AsnC ligand binding domain-containing protein n=1 Tax=Streptomyces violascens TaxID=67381 RepID=UPI0036CFE999